MRVLLVCALRDRVAAAALGRNVTYRPDLERAGTLELCQAVRAVRPQVLAAERLIDQDAAHAWRTAVPESPLLFVLRSGIRPSGAPLATLDSLGISVRLAGLHEAETDVEVLELAERAYNRLCTSQTRGVIRSIRGGQVSTRRRVALVGAGIVNLMTAYELARAGYAVRVLDASPDPREPAAWSRFGCTMSGGNARMFTLTEADNYSDKDPAGGTGDNTVFRAPVSSHGWRVATAGTFAHEEETWINAYEAIPPWLARTYTNDIFSFNRESQTLWEELIRADPAWFESVCLTPGVLRLYTDDDHFHWDVERQRRVGACRQVLSGRDVAVEYPALAEAFQRGVIVGGIEVSGFTVNVHDFVCGLVGLLEKLDVVFTWNRSVTGICRHDGDVVGLRTGDEDVTADHYVISPGVYGRHILRGTKSAGAIHGVLGVWLTVENVPPALTRSLKIARAGHTAEDANVTISRRPGEQDVLVIGSGYGYTGSDPTNIDPGELRHLFDAVRDTARTFFTRAYDTAVRTGLVAASERYCVRPWTASSLGIFEVEPVRGGGLLIVTGGHNTGGFAQSPSIARAVLRALQGRTHPMHELYHPARVARFHDRDKP